MYCFLCDRPARWRIPVMPKSSFLRSPLDRGTPEVLSVCEDCKRRVHHVEHDEDKDHYIVHMQSLT